MHTWFHVQLDQKILDGLYCLLAQAVENTIVLPLKKFYKLLFFSGSGHESRSGHHAFDCFIRTRYKKYVRSYIQWTQSLAHHASQFLLHYHTYIQKVEEKNKSYLLLLPNLSCNFGLWREFLLFLPYVTIILPPKKTTIGQNHL